MKRSFTLIELLVTIAVIAILAGMLLPALSRARESGRTATCAGGLRQLTAANILYSNDFGVFVKIRADKASTIYWYGANVSGGMDPGAGNTTTRPDRSTPITAVPRAPSSARPSL